LRCSFTNQLACSVVVIHDGFVGRDLLYALSKCIDPGLHQAQGGVGRDHAATGDIGKLVGAVVDDAAVGVGVDHGCLGAADLGQAVAAGFVAIVGDCGAVDLAGPVAGGVVAIGAAGGGILMAREAVQHVVAVGGAGTGTIDGG